MCIRDRQFVARDQTELVLSYIPIHNGQWVLLTLVPAALMSREVDLYAFWNYIVLALLLIFCGLILMLSLYRNWKHRRRLGEIAFMDPLTRAPNDSGFRLLCRRQLDMPGLSPSSIVFINLDVYKRQVKYEMQPTNKQKDVRYFASGNDMLKKGEFFYEYATGGKIGWTEDAGYTIVTTASKDGVNLIAVVLKNSSKNARYTDTRTLFDYGFANYKQITIPASSFEEKTIEIKKRGQLWATAKFKMSYDFKILAKTNDCLLYTSSSAARVCISKRHCMIISFNLKTRVRKA